MSSINRAAARGSDLPNGLKPSSKTLRLERTLAAMMPEAERAVLHARHSALMSPRKRRTPRKKINPAKLKRIRLAVFERDGYACKHCGLHFPPPAGYDGSHALVRPSGIRLRSGRSKALYLALDHVRPHSLGGPFEEGNLQALRSTCNGRKGASA